MSGRKKNKMIQLPNINIIAFDPGETTGIARVVNGQLKWTGVMSHEEILQAVATDTLESLHLGPLSMDFHMVYEQFLLYLHRGKSLSYNTLIPVRVIGYLEVWAKRCGLPFYPNMAVHVKQFADDAKLEAFDFMPKRWGPNDETFEHRKDACRHALYFMLTASYIGKPKE
jgi:hypothetical protein